MFLDFYSIKDNEIKQDDKQLHYHEDQKILMEFRRFINLPQKTVKQPKEEIESISKIDSELQQKLEYINQQYQKTLQQIAEQFFNMSKLIRQQKAELKDWKVKAERAAKKEANKIIKQLQIKSLTYSTTFSGFKTAIDDRFLLFLESEYNSIPRVNAYLSEFKSFTSNAPTKAIESGIVEKSHTNLNILMDELMDQYTKTKAQNIEI